MRRGFLKNSQFNLMVTGHAKSGKSDFIQTLFETVVVSKFIPESDAFVKGHEIPPLFPVNVTVPTPSTCSIECTPIAGSSHKVTMRLIDTPGLSIPLGMQRAGAESIEALERYAQDWVQAITSYIDHQFALTLENETKLKRNPKIRETHVHACLYLFSPDVVLSNHGLSTMDVIALKGLCKKANVIPCLSKADLVSVRELKLLRQYLHEDFMKHNLQIYNFAEDLDDFALEESLVHKIPFCLVNSEELVPSSGSSLREMGVLIDDQKILGREFIWGIMEVENSKHCDFNLLKAILFDSHMQDLKDSTKENFYEVWRTLYMKSNSRTILLPADLAAMVGEIVSPISPPTTESNFEQRNNQYSYNGVIEAV